MCNLLFGEILEHCQEQINHECRECYSIYYIIQRGKHVDADSLQSESLPVVAPVRERLTLIDPRPEGWLAEPVSAHNTNHTHESKSCFLCESGLSSR